MQGKPVSLFTTGPSPKSYCTPLEFNKGAPVSIPTTTTFPSTIAISVALP